MIYITKEHVDNQSYDAIHRLLKTTSEIDYSKLDKKIQIVYLTQVPRKNLDKIFIKLEEALLNYNMETDGYIGSTQEIINTVQKTVSSDKLKLLTTLKEVTQLSKTFKETLPILKDLSGISRDQLKTLTKK